LYEHLGELAYHGHRVKMYDANIDSLNSAYERIEEDKQHLRQDGLLPQLNFIVCMVLLSCNFRKTNTFRSVYLAHFSLFRLGQHLTSEA